MFVSLLPRHLLDCTRYLRRYSTLTNCSNLNSSNKSTILASFEWSQRLMLYIQCTEIWSIAFRCMHPFECTDTIGSCRFPVYSWTRQEIVSFVISCWVAVCAETMRCTFLYFLMTVLSTFCNCQHCLVKMLLGSRLNLPNTGTPPSSYRTN